MEWREKVAHVKTARFHDERYWGKPVPGFGDPNAEILIVGLAPAAHGANRTGRMFTGDRSGEWLYGTLHKFDLSNSAVSTSADDGLTLKDCYVTAVIRCAPPANKPTKNEILNCNQYLLDELTIFHNLRVIVALGRIAFDSTIDSVGKLGMKHFDRHPQFAHGTELKINDELTLIASYHPSQQNTFTKRLTKPMFESIFRRAKSLIEV